MSIDNADITIVMQGGLNEDYDVRYVADYLKTLFPGSKLLLATQESQIPRGQELSAFNEVVLTPDPGALPSVKFGGKPHNVNRQIASSYAGLRAVTTPYAMKLRADSYLSSRKAVDLWTHWDAQPAGPRRKGASRVIAVSLFTVNPHLYERMPYHVSDWFHFGRTEDLLKFWSCPHYDFELATWYEKNPYKEESLPREREFRSRFATEQWLTMNYLYETGSLPLQYHNDCTPEIIAGFEADLCDNFVVAHPIDIDLVVPRYQKFYRRRSVNMGCYSYEDWKRIIAELRGLTDTRVGFTRWPRTIAEKKLYLAIRRIRLKREV